MVSRKTNEIKKKTLPASVRAWPARGVFANGLRIYVIFSRLCTESGINNGFFFGTFVVEGTSKLGSWEGHERKFNNALNILADQFVYTPKRNKTLKWDQTMK